MHIVKCKCCGEDMALPDVLVCPYCLKSLADCTDEYAKKHVSRCSVSMNPRMYSRRGPGRPSKAEMALMVQTRLAECEEEQ